MFTDFKGVVQRWCNEWHQLVSFLCTTDEGLQIEMSCFLPIYGKVG